jgi:transcriptional regulator with XRE-family HTH domain
MKPSVGATVRAWRIHRKLTVTQLAEQIGVKKGYISELEHERIQHPRPDRLTQIALALELNPLDIINGRLPIEVESKPSEDGRSEAAEMALTRIALTQAKIGEMQEELAILQLTLVRLSQQILPFVKKRGNRS